MITVDLIDSGWRCSTRRPTWHRRRLGISLARSTLESAQILAITDTIAECVRKIGGAVLRSIAHIGRSHRVLDNYAMARCRPSAAKPSAPSGLGADNQLRATSALCQSGAAKSLWKNWHVIRRENRRDGSTVSFECIIEAPQ
jgi:hypothetical protein